MVYHLMEQYPVRLFTQLLYRLVANVSQCRISNPSFSILEHVPIQNRSLKNAWILSKVSHGSVNFNIILQISPERFWKSTPCIQEHISISVHAKQHNSTNYVLPCVYSIHFLSYRTVVYLPVFIADKAVKSFASVRMFPPPSVLQEVYHKSRRKSASCVKTQSSNCFGMLRSCWKFQTFHNSCHNINPFPSRICNSCRCLTVGISPIYTTSSFSSSSGGSFPISVSFTSCCYCRSMATFNSCCWYRLDQAPFLRLFLSLLHRRLQNYIAV